MLGENGGVPVAKRLQQPRRALDVEDRKSTRLNSSHDQISYAVFCLKKKKNFSHINVIIIVNFLKEMLGPGALRLSTDGWKGAGSSDATQAARNPSTGVRRT